MNLYKLKLVRLFTLAFLTASFFTASEIQAKEQMRQKEIQALGSDWLHADKSDFIWIIPASFGWTLFTAVGNVVAWPGKIIGNAVMGNFELEMFVPPIEFADRYFGRPGSYIVGGPFWAAEKVFWEIPAEYFKEDAESSN